MDKKHQRGCFIMLQNIFRKHSSRLLLNFRATCIYMIIFQCKFMQQYCSSIFIIFTKFIKYCKKKYTAYNSLLCGNVHKVFFVKKIERFQRRNMHLIFQNLLHIYKIELLEFQFLFLDRKEQDCRQVGMQVLQKTLYKLSQFGRLLCS